MPADRSHADVRDHLEPVCYVVATANAKEPGYQTAESFDDYGESWCIGSDAVRMQAQDSVAATYTDEGRLFVSGEVAAPDADALNESGYGRFLIKTLMDEVVYTPAALGTALRLMRRRASAEP